RPGGRQQEPGGEGARDQPLRAAAQAREVRLRDRSRRGGRGRGRRRRDGRRRRRRRLSSRGSPPRPAGLRVGAPPSRKAPLRSMLRTPLLRVLVFVLLAAAALADVVVTRDGRRIEGVIVRETATEVVV